MTSHNPYQEVDSAYRRFFLIILTSRIPMMLYHILYIIILLPILFIFKLRARRIHPDNFRVWVYDKITGFHRHTKRWNERALKFRQPEVAAIRSRMTWLEENIQIESELEDEKNRLSQEIINQLRQKPDWIAVTDEGERRRLCADYLDSLTKSVRWQTMALAADVLRRKIDGTRLHDVQLHAAVSLADGNFIELRNGEGKTFVSVLVLTWAAIRMQALRVFCSEKGISVPFGTCFSFTANDYLVRRDLVWLKDVYETMGFSAFYLLSSDRDLSARHRAYEADIVIMGGTDFGFDYLRNACREFEEHAIGQTPYFVLVDEADQLLIDEARTPLILSGESRVKSTSFVENAWIRQVNIWTKKYFLENQLFIIDADGVYNLTPAGRIYLRVLIDESDLNDWDKLTKLLRKHNAAIIIELIMEVLLQAPALSAQLSSSIKTEFRKFVGRNTKKLEKDADTGRLVLTPEAVDEIIGLITQAEWKPNLKDLKEISTWILLQIRQAKDYSPKEIQFFRNIGWGRRLGILRRLSRPKDFIIRILEFFINELAQASDSVRFPESFQEGLWILIKRMTSGQSALSTLTFPSWLVFHGVPSVAMFIAPALSKASASSERGIASDVAVLISAHKLLGKISNLSYSQNATVQRLVQDFALVGAFLQNFLFIPDSGQLTKAGRQVAYFLEKHCRQRGLAENYSAGGIVDLIEKSLYAYFGIKEDEDYIIKNGEVILVNQITGRKEPSKHFGRSLHPFVQIKHGLPIREPIPTKRTITVQNLAVKTMRMTGMSGTLIIEEKQLRELYSNYTKKPVVVQIPPRTEPYLKKEPLIFALSRFKKWQAIAEEIVQQHLISAQPILVITSSVEASMELSDALSNIMAEKEQHFPFYVLNAIYEELEEEIVSWAGQPGSVTIASQMAARGTDIVISEKSLKLGGLYVIIGEFHEARRLDIQAQGRVARHGEPGRSRFYLSIEDKLAHHIFHNEKFTAFLKEKFGNSDENLEGFPKRLADVSLRGIRAAQEIQQFNFHRQRKLDSKLDSIVDCYRDDLYVLRDKFCTGVKDDALAGLEIMIGVFIENCGVGNDRNSLWKISQDMSMDLIDKGLDKTSLARKYSGLLTFPVSELLLEPIVRAYESQQTPSVDIEANSKPVSVHHLIFDALCKSARHADLETVGREWEKLASEFDLKQSTKPLQWKQLLERLDSLLILGFNWDAWSVAEDAFDRLVHQKNRHGTSLSELMRKAVFETLSSLDTDHVISTGLKDNEKKSNAKWINISDTDVDQTILKIKEVFASAVCAEPLRMKKFCKEYLGIIDKIWEQALDDIQLIKIRFERDSIDFNAWSTLRKELGLLLRKVFIDLSYELMDLLDPIRESSAYLDSQPPGERWLSLDLLGPVWFLDEDWSEHSWDEPDDLPKINVSMTEGEDESVMNQDDLIQEIDRAKTGDSENQHLEEGEIPVKPSVQGNGEEEPPVKDISQAGISWIELKRMVTQQHNEPVAPGLRVPFTDEVLCGEYDEGDEDYWMAQSERLHRQNDGLLSMAFLDLIRDNNKTALSRTLLFESFGCRNKELEYLRLLREQGRIRVRLRLRMTYLLCEGSAEERKEAVHIIMNEGVPEAIEQHHSNDYNAVQALDTALSQIIKLGEFKSAILLFLKNKHILEDVKFEQIQIYSHLAEALSRSEQAIRQTFQKTMGIESSSEWLSKLFSQLYSLYKQANHEFTWVMREEKADYLLMRIALFARNSAHSIIMIKEIAGKASGSERWNFLAMIFGSCGYDFERRLCLIRFAILEEDFERAEEETSKLLQLSDDEEVFACRVYALIGIARCLDNFRHGRESVEQYLAESVTILTRCIPTSEDPYVANLLVEALSRAGQHRQAIEVAEANGATEISWYSNSLLWNSLLNIDNPDEVLVLLESLSGLNLQEVNACRVVTKWFAMLRQNQYDTWILDKTHTVLNVLQERWSSLSHNSNKYFVHWYLGDYARLHAEWLENAGKYDQARDMLSRALNLWKHAINLTHKPEPPYISLLKRHERLDREIIEVALRRGLQKMKLLGRRSLHAD